MHTATVFMTIQKLADWPLTQLLQHPRLSAELKQQAAMMTPDNQQRFLAGRALLVHLLEKQQAFIHLPPIISGENGRPQFDDPSLPDFNISHSGDYIAAAIVTQGKIGIDLEQQRPRQFAKIVQNIFTQTEQHWLQQQSDQLAAFWQLWTLREAALKLAAKGVWQMRQLQIDPQQLQVTAPFLPHCYAQYQQTDHYHLSFCTTAPVATLITI